MGYVSRHFLGLTCGVEVNNPVALASPGKDSCMHPRWRPAGKRALAAAAWRLIRASAARHPGRLRTVEAGSGSGPYHVLVLCDGRTGAGHHPLAMLDVGGSLHRVARADGQPLEADAARVLNLVPWRFLCFPSGTG